MTDKNKVVAEISRKMGIVNQDTGTEPDWDKVRTDLMQMSLYTLRRILASLAGSNQ